MIMTQDNIIDRDQLLEAYTVDELIAEVEEYNPDLLEQE